MDFFKSQFSDILNGKEVSLPRFDFISGKRIENHCKIQMKKNDFLIVEGIHSLNPVISNEFSHKTVKSLFINVEDEISNDEKTLLNARQLRLVRRIVRDFNFRGSSVENTFHLWKNVVKNEDLSLLPFREDADFQINTFIEYECGVCLLYTSGIVAAHFCEKYSKPCLVISIGDDGIAKGSCRSVEGFNIYEADVYKRQILLYQLKVQMFRR